MPPLPVEVLLGVYLGLLTGVVPALISGVLGFIFRYFTGVSLAGFAVVVFAVAVAGVNGGLLGLVDPTIIDSPRLVVAVLVVMMLSLYAHGQGDRLGATLPRRFSLRSLGRRTLSADVIHFVGGVGTVTLRPVGEIDDIEGYPPLPADLRARIRADTWGFPADLPLSELESRLEDRLRTEYDLADVAVSLDARGRATVAAAPPAGGLSKRIPSGKRAVSVEALVPTGIARGDHATVRTADATVDGTVLSARSAGGDSVAMPAADAGDDEAQSSPVTAAPTTDGGEGRVTLAVDRTDATALLRADRGRVAVRSRGEGREFELVSLLRRAGKRFGKVTIRDGGSLAGTTLGAATLGETCGVAVLAARGSEANRDWTVSPSGTTTLSTGDELFVAGSRDALDRLREVA